MERLRDTGDRQYLLSPQDLAAHDLVEPLARLGVRSFKIEGRLKSAEYVAITSQTYRAAIDAAFARQPFALEEQKRRDLQQSFSRGFSHGFLSGINHQVLVPGRFPKSRGVKIGTVVDKTPRGVVVEVDGAIPSDFAAAIKPGDGIVFDEGHPEQDEQGGRLVEVLPRQPTRNSKLEARSVELVLRSGSVNLAAIALGSLVWKTDDPALRRRMEQSYARDVLAKREPVRFLITGSVGGPVEVSVRNSNGRTGAATWPGPLQLAQKHSVSEDLLREQLGRLGDSPFELADIENNLPLGVMIPKSVLNDLRRQAIAALLANIEAARDRTTNPGALENFARALGRSRANQISNRRPSMF